MDFNPRQPISSTAAASSRDERESRSRQVTFIVGTGITASVYRLPLDLLINMPPRLEGLAQPEADKPVVLSDLDPAVFEAAFEWLYGDTPAKKGQSVMSKAKVKAPQHLDQETTFTTLRNKPPQTLPKKQHSILEPGSVQASNTMKENATPDKPLRPHRGGRQASVYKLPTTNVMPYPNMLPLQPSMHQHQPFYTFNPLYWPHNYQHILCETPSEATRE